ncbi:MAG TPA: hypothetical protein VMS31_14315, partial [Pyrinomonadaceae bacterium]|nr:hypothetical protein [Pyrinomonadaceae bacterium]
MRLHSREKGLTQGPALQLYEVSAQARELIADGEFDGVIELLREFAKLNAPSFLNDLIILEGRHRRLAKREIDGSVTSDDAEVEKVKIAKALLALVDEIDIRPQTNTLSTFRELPPAEVSARNSYLRKLEADVDARLRVSIHRAVISDLGIKEAATATHVPWAFKDAESKRDFKDFLEAFETFDRRMLLLGGPGSGKTTTNLYIAEDLIKRALENLSAPIPLLVNLSKFQP